MQLFDIKCKDIASCNVNLHEKAITITKPHYHTQWLMIIMRSCKAWHIHSKACLKIHSQWQFSSLAYLQEGILCTKN